VTWEPVGNQLRPPDPGTTKEPVDGAYSEIAPSSVTPGEIKRNATCRECGRDFQINPCHAKTHRFCSVRCRMRNYRRKRVP
jgi:hypothetical protein